MAIQMVLEVDGRFGLRSTTNKKKLVLFSLNDPRTTNLLPPSSFQHVASGSVTKNLKHKYSSGPLAPLTACFLGNYTGKGKARSD